MNLHNIFASSYPGQRLLVTILTKTNLSQY